MSEFVVWVFWFKLVFVLKFTEIRFVIRSLKPRVRFR